MHRSSLTALVAAATLFNGAASAQAIRPLIPFEKNLDVYVTDSGTDRVLRLSDTDYDGDYNDPGEVVVFYDDQIGTIELGNNNSIAVLPSGVVLVTDTTSDIVLALRDLDGDGECNDVGEHWIWFDGNPANNAAGIFMASPSNLCVDSVGRVFIADANTGGGGLDSILLLQDLNGDGDANDVGEAQYYYIPTNGSAVGDVIPNSIGILPSGDLLYLEGGSTGFASKALWRLEDTNRDGFIDPATEVFIYWFPPTLPFNPFIWDFSVDRDGAVFLADTGNDVIWRLKDINGDGFIDSGAEEVLYYVSPTPSLVWTVKPDEHGRLLVAESQAPDRVLLMEDLDGNGWIDPATEVSTVYTSAGADVVINNVRGLCWRPAPQLDTRPTAPVGTYATYRVLGTAGDEIVIMGSLAAIPAIVVPPLGELEIDTSVAARFFRSNVGVVGPNGGFGGAVRVPNDPSLVGLTLHLQAVVGGSTRRVLTNRATALLQ